MSTAPATSVDSWEYLLRPGGGVERAVPMEPPRSLSSGEVRLRFLVGGICGSDIGAIAGVETFHAPRGAGVAPLHEVVAEVVESRDERFIPGHKVVGTGLTGLASELVEDADRLILVPSTFSVGDAVAIQPVGTVLRAVDAMPSVAGRDVVVLGAGAIGLAFMHVLRSAGASRILAVDTSPGREELARKFGATEFIGATGQQWSAEYAPEHPRPDVVVDAVGRQPDIIHGALTAIADGGFVLGFGSAAHGDYPIPYAEMFNRNLTLSSGRTRDNWTPVLERGAEYLDAHRGDFDGYISHRFPVTAAAEAYELCSRPDPTRVKVVLEADFGRAKGTDDA